LKDFSPINGELATSLLSLLPLSQFSPGPLDGFDFLDPTLLALGKEPPFLAHIFQDAALLHFLAETPEQTLSRPSFS